ncbi:MAG: hypothetical protein ACYTBZ_30860, partial [Planctomycetota bacterium]
MPGDFTLTFDWTMPTNSEGEWTYYINIGTASTMVDSNDTTGVGPGLYNGESLGMTGTEAIDNDLSGALENNINGTHYFKLVVDASAYTYDYYRDTSLPATTLRSSGVSFVNNQSTLNQIRIATSNSHIGTQTMDNIKIVLNVTNVPEETLGTEESQTGGATWAADEDTSHSFAKNTITRLRIEVSNEGGQSSGAVTYQLQVAETTDCSSGSYSAVPADASGHWQIVDSSYITDAESTSNIASGLTDEATTFVAGQLKDTGNTTGSITLGADEFTEIEYAVQATSNATDGGHYCFRLYDTTAGDTLDTYTQYAEASIGFLPSNLDQIHYRWRNDDGAETPDWWDTNYPYRMKVTFGTSHSILPAGFTTSVTMDTRPTATNVALTSGDDVRVVWQPTSGPDVELDRIGDTWNNANTTIEFRLQSDIPADADEDTDGSYYIYYGFVSAGMPPIDEMNVYYFADFFTRSNSTTVGNGWTEWTQGGDMSISGNALIIDSTGDAAPPQTGIKQSFPLGAMPGDFTLTFDWTMPTNSEGE